MAWCNADVALFYPHPLPLVLVRVSPVVVLLSFVFSDYMAFNLFRQQLRFAQLEQTAACSDVHVLAL